MAGEPSQYQGMETEGGYLHIDSCFCCDGKQGSAQTGEGGHQGGGMCSTESNHEPM